MHYHSRRHRPARGPRPRLPRGSAQGQSPASWHSWPRVSAPLGPVPTCLATRRLQVALKTFSERIDTEIGDLWEPLPISCRPRPGEEGAPPPMGFGLRAPGADSTLPGVNSLWPPHRVRRCQPHSSLNRFS